MPHAPAPAVDAAGQPVDAGTPIPGTPAPDFTLTDQFGRRRSLADFRGHVVVLAFIDSRCTTTCPLTAEMMRQAKALLGPAGAGVQLLAVNANPDATAVADVLAWSQQHGMTDQWLFLTGPAATLQGIWQAYHVGVTVEADGEVTHTDATYVLDAQGRERYVFTTDPDFSGTAPEAYDLALRVASVLGGGRPVRLPPAPAAHAAGGGYAFALPGLAPDGSATEVRVGQGTPYLVAFFSTWCTACREDLQALAAYAAAAPARHLPAVVGVDLRVAEPSTAWVQQFLAGARVAFPVALDDSGRVSDAYRVDALPYLALVSADGRLLWHHSGVLSADQLLAQVAAAAR